MQDKKFNFGLIWGIFVLIIYFGMAVLLVFTDLFHFATGMKIAFSAVFLLYGTFRAYRLWKDKK